MSENIGRTPEWREHLGNLTEDEHRALRVLDEWVNPLITLDRMAERVVAAEAQAERYEATMELVNELADRWDGTITERHREIMDALVNRRRAERIERLG